MDHTDRDDPRDTTHVFAYRLSDKPQVWRIVVCPGDDLAEATRVVQAQFGAERVLEVRVHQAVAG